MAEEKEQLKIEATLDTSKLKQQAQQGMQAVVQEEKKVEQQSQQTSRAIDKISDAGKKVGDSIKEAGNKSTQALKQVGNSLQSTGDKGAQALKQVGDEAEKTANKISDIDKSVKNLKLGQAIGVASRFANSDIGKGIGNVVGDSFGLSDSEKGLAGNTLQGGLQGAAMGAMLAGPLGAAVGGLAGAASGLLQAAEEQKKAARELAASGENRVNAILKEQLNKELAKEREDEFNRIAANPFEKVADNSYANGEGKEVTAIQGVIDKLKWNIGGYEEQIQWAVDALKTLQSMDTSGWSKEDVESWNAEVEKEAKAYEEYNARLEDARKRLAAFEALLAQLNNLPVGPEIPDYIREQRDAEANAPVGPEIPPEIRAEREKEARDTLARKQTIAGIRYEDKFKGELKDLEGQVRNSSEDEYLKIRDGLTEAIRNAKDKMEKSTNDQDAFAVAQKELAEAERKLAAVQKARKDAIENEKKVELEKNQKQLKELQGQAAELKERISGMSNMKLTDSLTRIGGGKGYGVQMQGINNYVKNISTNIVGIKAVMQKCLENIQNINEKYSPYNGQFISED